MATARARSVLASLLVLLSCAGARPPAPAPHRLNVVVFLVDDLGWRDHSLPRPGRPGLPAEGVGGFSTPHLVELAAAGLRFTDAYAASPVCTPTRTAILTGQHPARTRITNWTLRGDRSAKHPTLLPPAWNLNGLSDSAETPRAVVLRTLPGVLRRAGYVTMHVGKAHFGSLDSPGADPTRLGFEHNVAGHAAGGPASHLGRRGYASDPPGSVWDVPDLGRYRGTDTPLAEALTLEAERLLDETVATGRPFFLHLAHYAVHAPIEEDARFVQRYLDAGYDPREARYASLVEGVDDSLGRILAKLDELGVADDTLVLYLSDNGGLSAHARGGTPHTHNLPLKSGKGSAYEGGVRVPMVVRWPGVVAPGSVTATPAIAEDVLPTVLTACGLELPDQALDGADLGPVLRGGTLAARDLWWHYPHQWGAPGPGIHPYSALRRGRWKLIHYYAEPRDELFDLEADLGETHDLAAERPELAGELARALGAHLAAVDGQTPLTKENGLPTPLPGSP